MAARLAINPVVRAQFRWSSAVSVFLAHGAQALRLLTLEGAAL